MPTKEEALEFVPTVSWWQTWEIVPGVMTPGGHSVADTMTALRAPADLSGKRVLDIGGWNGCFSFECERRGASEVIMIEPSPPESTFFESIKEFLHSKVQRVSGTVYDLDPSIYGYFDVVLFLGVVYHLRYPLLALDNIRRVCRSLLFTESATLDEAALDATGAVRPADTISVQMNKTPLLQFAKNNDYFNDTTNWFIPNRVGLDSMITSAGFRVENSVATRRYYSRAVVEGSPPMLTQAHEGIDFNLHVGRLLGPLSAWAEPAGS